MTPLRSTSRATATLPHTTRAIRLGGCGLWDTGVMSVCPRTIRDRRSTILGEIGSMRVGRQDLATRSCRERIFGQVGRMGHIFGNGCLGLDSEGISDGNAARTI